MAKLDDCVAAFDSLQKRFDAYATRRADAATPETTYRGYEIYATAGKFEVAKRGTSYGRTFPSVEAAKKWVDLNEKTTGRGDAEGIGAGVGLVVKHRKLIAEMEKAQAEYNSTGSSAILKQIQDLRNQVTTLEKEMRGSGV